MSTSRLITSHLFQAGCLVLVCVLAIGPISFANHQHMSAKFEGPKANVGHERCPHYLAQAMKLNLAP